MYQIVELLRKMVDDTNKNNTLPKQKRMNSNIFKTTQIQIVTCFQNKRIRMSTHF